MDTGLNEESAVKTGLQGDLRTICSQEEQHWRLSERLFKRVGRGEFHQPGLQFLLDFLGGFKGADHVAPHHLHVMGEARDADHRVELGREPGIGGGGIGVGADEAGIGHLQASRRPNQRLAAEGQ
jgi:hypothetical protein